MILVLHLSMLKSFIHTKPHTEPQLSIINRSGNPIFQIIFKHGLAAMTYPDKYYCKVGQREGEGCFSHKKADVPCYISRPTEKKIVMWYMITVSLCSIALGEDFEDSNTFIKVGCACLMVISSTRKTPLLYLAYSAEFHAS